MKILIIALITSNLFGSLALASTIKNCTVREAGWKNVTLENIGYRKIKVNGQVRLNHSLLFTGSPEKNIVFVKVWLPGMNPRDSANSLVGTCRDGRFSAKTAPLYYPDSY